MSNKITMQPKIGMSFIGPRPLTILTTIDSKENVTSMTAALTMPASINPPLLILGISPQRQTMKNIVKNGEIVLNIPSYSIAKQAWIVGMNLPNGIKLDVAGLTTTPSIEIKPPIINECYINYECEVVNLQQPGDQMIVTVKPIVMHIDLTLKNMIQEKQGKKSNSLFDNYKDIRKKMKHIYFAGFSGEPLGMDIGLLEEKDKRVGGVPPFNQSKKWFGEATGRGILSPSESETLKQLCQQWKKHQDPEENNDIRKKLIVEFKNFFNNLKIT